MKCIDADVLLSELKQFAAERDWGQFHSVKNLSTALMVEAAELAEIFQWKTEEQSNSAHQDEVCKSRIAEELADVFGYLLRIADHCEIDLGAALAVKIQKNAEKYPVGLSKGNSKKYTELG